MEFLSSFPRHHFAGKPVVVKWRNGGCLISQAVIRKGGNDYMNVFLTVSITYLGNMVTSLLWPLFSEGYTFPYKKKH